MLMYSKTTDSIIFASQLCYAYFNCIYDIGKSKFSLPCATPCKNPSHLPSERLFICLYTLFYEGKTHLAYINYSTRWPSVQRKLRAPEEQLRSHRLSAFASSCWVQATECVVEFRRACGGTCIVRRKSVFILQIDGHWRDRLFRVTL